MANLKDSGYSAILKDLQDGRLVNQLSEQFDFWKYVKTNLKKVLPAGKRLIRPLRVKYGMPAIKNMGFNGNFPAAKAASYVQLIAEKKFIAAHMEIPYFVMEASKTDKGAFVKAMDDEIDSKNIGLAKQLTRQALGNGAGEIAQLSSASGATTGTITVDSSNSAVGCIQWVEDGDHLIPYTSTADDTPVAMSNAATYLEVISVDEDAKTFVVQPHVDAQNPCNFDAADYLAGNIFVRSGIVYKDTSAVLDFGSRSEEIVGLEILISKEGKLHGIDRAAISSYQSYVKDGGGDVLVTDMVQAAITGANKKGDGRPEATIMSHNTFNRFVQISEEDRRLIATKDGSKGFDSLGYRSNWGAVKFIVEKYCRDDRMFMIDPKFLELYGQDFEFYQPEGSPIINKMPASGGGFTTNLGADYVAALELFNTKPAGMGRVDNFILG